MGSRKNSSSNFTEFGSIKQFLGPNSEVRLTPMNMEILI
jgi:hypothetical protein